MPTYQYRCQACHNDLEIFQKFTDASLTECPECGGNLRKVFNAVGVVFKGSGFYATDSRKTNSASSNSSSSGSSGESSSAKDSSGSKDSSSSKESAKPASTQASD